MSLREDLIGMLSSGRKPERIPFLFMGFHDEKAMRKLAPGDCWDENTYYIPSDDPPRDRFAPEPRTEESRLRAMRMSRYLDMATVGVGKGGVFPFGHGGPGEIQPEVIERAPGYKILRYEGGHRRRFNYDPHSIRYYDFPIRGESDLDRLRLPDMKNPDRFRDIAEDCRVAKAFGLVPVASIQGFFSGIHNSFMDYEETMVNLLLKPEFMRRVTEVLARMNLDAVEMLLDRGVEIVTLCDDLGNAGGLLLSPELIRTFFMPWLEELARLVHDRGAYLHLHSHGNIRELLPDFVSIGVDILNPFDWDENPDLPELVRSFGRDVVFCGGVVGDLSRFPVDQVDHIVRRACGLAGHAEKGYILMTGGARDSLTLKEWNAWRDIFARARER